MLWIGTMNMKFIRATVMVVLATITSCAQSQSPQDQSSKAVREVVEEYCKRTAEGAWLGPERWDELQDFFLYDVGPWSPAQSLSVVSRYKVGDPTRDTGGGTVGYHVEVDYLEWGSIDFFLHFTRARGPRGEAPAVGEPVKRQTYQALYLRAGFIKSGPPRDDEKTGALRWRIALFTSPGVYVDVALRWVAEMRDKTNDPAIKYNAEKTLAILRDLSAGAPVPTQPAAMAKESPSDIARRFVRLESGLLPDQWSELTDFFVETPKPRWNKVHIVDVVNIGTDTNEDSSDVSISTNSLGELDSSLRLSNYPSMRLPPIFPSVSACYGDDYFGFNLLLSDKHWEIGTGGAVKQFNGPPAWRIEDPSFEPLITLNTAIRYVRQMRAKSADPVVRANAAKTLTILGYYKKYKLLPHELPSNASGGCG